MQENPLGKLSDLLDPALAAQLRRIELSTRKIVDTDLMGRYRSAFRGSGLTFADLREYQAGDDIKYINWKATARSSKVYVKSFEEERQLSVLLAVDISRSTEFGSKRTKHALALEFSALIATLARICGDALGICLFSDQVEEFVPVGSARSQFQKVLLSLLAKRDLRPATDMQRALNFISSHQRRASIIFIVSDFFCGAFEYELRQLAARHDVICVLLDDLIDGELPSAGLVLFEDAESGRRCLIDTGSRRTKEKLAALHNERINSLSRMCSRCNCDFLDTKDGSLQALRRLMEQRTRIRSR